MSPMTPVLHPTGSASFGTLSEMRAPGQTLPAGDIRLFRGRHTGPNSGFGAAHIWAEHGREMAALGFYAYEDVADFVAMIVRACTPVFFGDQDWRSLRVMAVRSRSGTAILEYRESRDGDAYWSIVTVYTGTRTHGTRVGTVR